MTRPDLPTRTSAPRATSWHRPAVLLLATATAVGSLLLPATTYAADGAPDEPGASPQPTALTLGLPGRSRSDLVRSVDVSLTDVDGAPVPDREVVVEVAGDDGTWVAADRLLTDAQGTAAGEVVVPRAPSVQTWRARVAGEELLSDEQPLRLVPWRTRIRRSGPDSVVDGRRIEQTWRVTTGRGDPVADATLVVRGRVAGRLDKTVARTDADGTVTLRDRPRRDSRWVARLRAGTWHEAADPDVAEVDNLPPGPVVRLPRSAPRPKISLPPQQRSMRAGPRPRVTRIPARVWDEMKGVSWRPGCPVGRRDLRLVRVGYWGYDGYARRGEIVVNAATANTVAATFADVYRARLPIRSMYRVDRFGYSSRVRGGDDFASMDAGNTSGFNCRRVVNYSALSPHSYGFAIDINTWENPYRSRTGIVPNTYWQSRSHPLVAWRSTSHPMVRTLFRNGWSWPYGLGDTQHFSAPSSGRHARAARAAEAAEHELEHAAGHDDLTGYVPGSGIALD